MTKYLFSFCLLVLLVTPGMVGQENSSTTTYFFIRHAEKDLSNPSDRNPNLTEEGKSRALNWASMLKDTPVDMVYSSNYNRTIQTATPIAKSKNVEITLYDPRNSNDREFQKNTQGKTVVIVGHSNSTPTFVNKILGSKKHPKIDEKDYGKLFIVTISGNTITDTVLNIN